MKTPSPIVTEVNLDCSVRELWNAITDVAKMRRWFFENIPAFEARVGFKTEFNVHSGGRDFLHQWEITEVLPQKRITYHWKYNAYPGESHVHFEIFPLVNGTRLAVTHEGSDSFPPDIPEFKRESCESGWNYFIRERLKQYMESE